VKCIKRTFVIAPSGRRAGVDPKPTEEKILFTMKRLSELVPGTVARIHSFEKNELFLKLMEMGCVPGELIRVEQVAPLGDPISITVAGYNLSLRLDEAENIFMEEEVY
jgi:Fe2+ transport system protein FeoA